MDPTRSRLLAWEQRRDKRIIYAIAKMDKM
jgi:hypothetical protein